MNGPDPAFRRITYQRLSELPNVADEYRIVNVHVEALLNRILESILRGISQDVIGSNSIARVESLAEHKRDFPDETLDIESEGHSLLAAVETWASLASSCIAWVYAPQSPLPRGFAGWASRVAETLRRLTQALLAPLSLAAKALGAKSWSIGVSFPWGVSVGLGWE